LDVSFIWLFRVIRVLLFVFWSGRQETRKDYNSDVQTLMEAFFEHVVKVCSFH
jgi:hypothetical protein